MGKKLFILLFIICLAVGAASCGKKAPPQPPDESPSYSTGGK